MIVPLRIFIVKITSYITSNIPILILLYINCLKLFFKKANTAFFTSLSQIHEEVVVLTTRKMAQRACNQTSFAKKFFVRPQSYWLNQNNHIYLRLRLSLAGGLASPQANFE
ncbi:hypothetical protein CWB98_06375 [Pseudoalteromonas rubra]|uniref:Uncharacterized protein n=1 Tax=Pseudoalteromonas rubra TaxID=43658 RepID=A0A5S3X2H6_9GAMM|nr:hypothetical protein CWB98_06375 [Pseudoalteromonas rubra]